MPRANSIAAERCRVGDEPEKFDLARVIELDRLDLPPVGARDVHLRILPVSGEHNIYHAALADSVDIAALRGGQDLPRQLRRRRSDRGTRSRRPLPPRRRGPQPL